MKLLYQRFVAALETPGRGRDKVDAIGRAYRGYALEFRHFFDFCSRFRSHQVSAAAGPNEQACHQTGEAVMDLVVQAIQAIQAGLADGSVLQRWPASRGCSV
jgi:hypothetical protein